MVSLVCQEEQWLRQQGLDVFFVNTHKMSQPIKWIAFLILPHSLLIKHGILKRSDYFSSLAAYRGNSDVESF